MKLTWTGTYGTRVIAGQDFPDQEDDFVYEWTPGSWVDVKEDVGKWLLEYHRQEFVEYDDPKGRDHRTVKELLVEATELDIEGRSSMNREALLDAIYRRREELEGEPEGESSSEGSTETPSETPEEV